MGARRMQLLLDLDLEEEPVSGRVGLADAEPRSFIGYAALIATLQAIRSEEAEVAGAHPPAEDSS